MTCEHTSTIDDDRQGDVVCLDCGLVLDKIYRYESFSSLCSPLTEEYSSLNKDSCNKSPLNIQKNKYLNEDTALLITLCDRLHLNDKIRSSILDEWKKIKDWLLSSKKKYETDFKALVVMAIYEGLIKEKVPRPISHLCQDVGIQPKSVWIWIKLYKEDARKISSYKPGVFNTVDMLEYFLQPLNLNFKELQAVKKKVIFHQNCTSFAPRTLAGACVYVFLKETTIKNISMKDIANILGISVMSLYRCYKRIGNNNNR